MTDRNAMPTGGLYAPGDTHTLSGQVIPPTDTRRADILSALDAFIRQRAGLEYGNYGDPTSYRAEQRRITKQRHEAETLLAYVERSGMDADTLLSGFRAFSGRLTWTPADPDKASVGGGRLSYCTGQYFPTEYRAAVCAVLASALWNYWRDDFHARTGTYEGARVAILDSARRAFRSRGVREWFN